VTLASVLREKRLAVFLGPGGVGKTTVSAACALQAARQRRTLALTIDPAQRMADAMGIALGAKETRVAPGLDVAMLDTKQALDELVAKYAPSPERLQDILHSSFYQTLSDAFAGSEEFASAGKLYEYLQAQRYDLILVDTPPSKHALDFLEVPERLVRVFDSGAVQWLVKPSRVLRIAGGRFAEVLGRWTSQRHLEEMAEFFLQFDAMFLDMEQRVRAMRTILTDPAQTGIVLLATPEPASLRAALRFHAELTERLRLPVDALVVNRVLPDPPRDSGVPSRELVALYRGALEHVAGADPGLAEEVAAGMVEDMEHYRAAAEVQQRCLADLAKQVDCEVVQVPMLPEAVQSLEGLERIRAAIFGA